MLARAQCRDFSLEACNVLDLCIKTGDFRLQQLVFPVLCRDLRLKRDKHEGSDQAAKQRGQAETLVEAVPPPLALKLTVRQQVDQDHVANLRSARPQANRYEGASRASVLSAALLPRSMP